uniref:Ribosomal RNA large subunit methyltransferase K/L-like methyltransferase domain-containing protein n=1 Tax=Astatotilapia calliptera TaxID=8154 RepID=A0A3P8PSC1_ASTCA
MLRHICLHPGELQCLILIVTDTSFEHTAAEEVKEKIGVEARISKDRGRIYFPITTDKLFQVKMLSVDNLFVVVEEYDHYQFKQSKVNQQLASKLPWTNALEKKGHRKGGSTTKVKPSRNTADVAAADTEQQLHQVVSAAESHLEADSAADAEPCEQDSQEAAPEARVIKFRVTCNRAARDFGGAVQEFFQWKADMTKFDIEVLLNIHNEEMVIGIGAIEFSSSFYICSGNLCSLPIRTSSVDIIITDMPFGKRMGSKKKNWDLYPLCLREMARVCRPGSGKAVLLTQDKKCFAKVAMLMLQIMHIWVYILMKVSKEVEISTGRRQKKFHSATSFYLALNFPVIHVR